jgi:hypothetical protein
MRTMVRVWIMEPVSRIVGFSWPTSGKGEPSAIAFIEHVCRLAIGLPDGRTTRLTGRVILQQRGGIVTDVAVPISTERQPFRRALEELRHAVVSLELFPESEVMAALNWEGGDVVAGLRHVYRRAPLRARAHGEESAARITAAFLTSPASGPTRPEPPFRRRATGSPVRNSRRNDLAHDVFHARKAHAYRHVID